MKVFISYAWTTQEYVSKILLLAEVYSASDQETAPWDPAKLAPFPYNEDRRAILRAQLYGLTREELSYILDPATVMGQDYPSETFRVLKNTELRDHNEYLTGRLVLEAWDEEEGGV